VDVREGELPMRARRTAGVGAVILMVTACGGTVGTSHVVSTSPTPDAVTRAYVTLIRQYWIDLIAADGNAPTVCLYGPIDSVQCKARAEAQLAVQQKFLSDLETIRVPPQFTQPNAVLLQNVPIAISDLKAMVAAAATGDKSALTHATAIYVGEMEPTITDALDAIDPSVLHRR